MTTLYMPLVITNTLHFDFDLVSKWFEENYMILNADKCHFMCLGKDTENETYQGLPLVASQILKVTLRSYVEKPRRKWGFTKAIRSFK